jgi:hypothetical protein
MINETKKLKKNFYKYGQFFFKTVVTNRGYQVLF